ncbi:MAG: shikimate kinase [Clostridia bacterium]|nr:shikimate kinase [Clostridia bacterium]
MENLVLIGMPACGKSTAGVLVAKTLGYGFIDTDLVIQTQEKRLLSEIIEEKGIDSFIELENKVNSSIWADRCVISTGGSVVYGDEAMRHFAEIGTIVYIKLSYEEIQKRLGGILVSRGVVIKKGEDLKDLYDERVPLYEKYAHYTVNCEGLSVEETVHAICRLMQKTEK